MPLVQIVSPPGPGTLAFLYGRAVSAALPGPGCAPAPPLPPALSIIPGPASCLLIGCVAGAPPLPYLFL